jgi:hypothetical protein
MFEALKPFENLLKAGAVWLAGRGLIFGAVAVATTTFGLSGIWLPLIILPMAAAISSVNTQLFHSHREESLVSRYKNEIASVLHMSPDKVGLEQLYTVAYGNKGAGIAANPVLAEALNKNDTSRMVNMATHVVSAMLTLAVASVFIFNGGDVTQVVGSDAAKYFSHIGVGLGVGVTNFLMDQVLGFFADRMAGTKEATLDDSIRAIGKEVRKGFSVSPERVFGLYVTADKALAADIEEVYHTSYDKLPTHTQHQIVAMYDKQFGVTTITQLLNERRLATTELAFAIEGQESGVPLREPQPAELPDGDYKAEKTARGVVAGMKPVSSHVADVAMRVPEVSYDNVPPAPVSKPSYVARYATPIPQGTQPSFAERISQEELAAMDVKGRG